MGSMRKWKRRLKCGLALALAAALVGSNADSLMLSAFAEESTYQEDSVPAGEEDGTEKGEEVSGGGTAGRGCRSGGGGWKRDESAGRRRGEGSFAGV